MLNNPMRIVVTGGRDFIGYSPIEKALNAVHKKHKITCIIHGGASGVDNLADFWAVENNIERNVFNAKWSELGKAAGPIRNQDMIDTGLPDACVAFSGGVGTADMIRRVKKAGIPLWDTST